MTFISGTITSANPGPAIHAAMEPALIAAGFTLEDTVVIGARTHKVWKSPAAANKLGKDWFLDIGYPTTGVGTRFFLQPFEIFNAATDLGIRGAYSTNDVTIETTHYSRFGDTGYALETNWMGAPNNTNISLPLVTVAFNYWISITVDRVIFMPSQDPYILYCGLFKPTAAFAANAGSALFPLIVTRMVANSNAAGSNSATASFCAVTRLPRFTNLLSTTPFWGNYGWGYGAVCGVLAGAVRNAGRLGLGVSPATGDYGVVPVPVHFGSSTPLDVVAQYVGDLDGVAIAAGSSSVVRGDSISIDGKTWYATSAVNNYSLLFEGV